MDDMPRQIGDLIRLGTIEAVDGTRATVRLGDIVSPPLPWSGLAGMISLWCPPSVGEQVLVTCPEADIAHGVITDRIFSDANPAPASGQRLHLKMPDGTTLDYDPEAHALAVTLTSGTVTLTAPGGLTIEGDVQVNGKITASDDIKSDTDVIAVAVHLKTHVHVNTKPETGSFSGQPQ